MTRKAFTISFIFFLLLSQALYGEKDIYRPATPEDSLGIWKQVTVQSHNPDMDLSDPWFSGNQYFWFLPENGLKIMIVEKAEQENTGISATDLAMWKAAPTTMSVEWGPEGKAYIRHPERPPFPVLITYYPESFAPPEGSLPIPQETLPQKGDITITYMDRQTFSPLFFRLLRPSPH